MKKFIGVIIIIAAVLFVLESILGQDPDQRSYQYFDDMLQSVSYKTQSANPHFSNGQTQQAPVAGTIPRGAMPLPYGATVEESIRAGEELTSPFAADTTANIARGSVVYQNYCQVCHGVSGQGDGTVTRRGMPPPPSLLANQARRMKDGQIFHIITFGYNNMPGYAAQVDRDDRWHVIAYIRQLQQTALQTAQEAQNDTLNTRF